MKLFVILIIINFYYNSINCLIINGNTSNSSSNSNNSDDVKVIKNSANYLNSAAAVHDHDDDDHYVLNHHRPHLMYFNNKTFNNHRKIYHSKFKIDDLMQMNFPYLISDDIDLNPCKADGFMGDIALPNINYEMQWQKEKLNKTFQQELEQLKQEVYHEGLQVEEEGLTDIIRKKTKQPPINNDFDLNLNNKNRNDPSFMSAEGGKLKTPKPLKSAKINYIEPSIEQINTSEEDEIINATIIDSPKVEVSKPKAKSTMTIITTTPVPQKSPNTNLNLHIDESKIQSDQKNLSKITNNIHLQKKFIIAPTQAPTPRTTLPNIFSNSGGNGVTLDNVESINADGVIKQRRHRRRRQFKKNHHQQSGTTEKSRSDNYQKRLKRLKKELGHEEYSHADYNLHIIRHIDMAPYELEDSFENLLSKKKATIEHVEREIHEMKTSKVPLTIHDFDYGNSHPEEHHRLRRAATAKKERIWDYGVIPYEIDGNFSGAHKALFKQAMRHWENFTCIKFVERNPSEHPNYILFTERSCGCCSFVGKRGNGVQAISIGKNCDKFGIVVHELGHVVGFWHEHTRPDRENHVVIEKNNILQGQEYNFNKLTEDEVNSLGLPYDYNSIMHYARNTFSKGTYLDTILPIEVKGKKRPEIGQREKLSEGDISQANLLYKCPKCGKTFQENSGAFSSPNYFGTSVLVDPERCEWRITATHGERIVLNITDLDIFKSNNCRSDYIEIRDGYWHKSPVLGRYCGFGRVNELIKTTGSRMLVTYVTNSRQFGHKGFAATYEAVCGGEVDLESGGRLESPNYPLDYLPNKECIWKITVPKEHQVALKFSSFDVENHDNCAYDYVEVRDGESQDSPIIGIFCGSKVPPDLISTTNNKLFVKFVSDGSVQKAGFSATFIKEVDECKLHKHGCAHDCVNTLGGYECSCRIGYELHSDKKNCEDACGGEIELVNGTITSPSFPELYPISKYCVWEIIAPIQYRITLNFTHFELEGNEQYPQDCEYDSLTVYSKINEDTLKKHGIYCGARKPPLITSEGNVLRIEFNSDDTVQKSGFAAIFSSDVDECAVNNGECQHECRNTIGSYVCLCFNGYTLHDNGHDCKEGGCKYEITAPYGQIFSPNYPESYPPKKDCIWHFITTPGHRIRLQFTFFEMEPHPECGYDYIGIYDGNSSESQTLGRFCGSKTPHPISANSNEMYMVFKSDNNVQRKGFVATHSTACGGRLIATSQGKHFYSHANFGDQNYDDNADCDWTIESQNGQHVHLTFLSFDVESETSCSYDYVEIYGGLDETPDQLYGKFCGNSNPHDIISMNDALLIRFRSDDSVNFKGFSAYYATLNDIQHSDEDSRKSEDFSEYATPFPGSLKSIVKSFDSDDDEDDDDDDYEDENNSNSNKIKYDKNALLDDIID